MTKVYALLNMVCKTSEGPKLQSSTFVYSLAKTCMQVYHCMCTAEHGVPQPLKSLNFNQELWSAPLQRLA